MTHSLTRWPATVAAVVCMAQAAVGAPVTLGGVPHYPNECGCAPAAGGMVVGFWDDNGFDHLIDGSNDWTTNMAAIRNMIASPEHQADYLGTDDPDPHPDNCLADFMDTSVDPLPDYETAASRIAPGLVGYAVYVGYTTSTAESTTYIDWSDDTYWDAYVAEIDAGRPVVFRVDSNGDGSSDHYVAGYGYDPDEKEYIFLDSNNPGQQDAAFTGVAPGQNFGLRMVTTFIPMPEPATLALVGGGLGLALAGRIHKANPIVKKRSR
ncbi:MAG: C39 family peptidase [Phycisphaerae bacterium]